MRGVSSLYKQWLATQPGDDIAVFVVWSDQVGAQARHIPEAAELIPDPRARHYWDGDRAIGRAFQTLTADGGAVRLSIEAWDVWLLFDRDARWTDSGPPQPAWWEHQLRELWDSQPGRRLTGERFAAKAAELRAKGGAAEHGRPHPGSVQKALVKPSAVHHFVVRLDALLDLLQVLDLVVNDGTASPPPRALEPPARPVRATPRFCRAGS